MGFEPITMDQQAWAWVALGAVGLSLLLPTWVTIRAAADTTADFGYLVSIQMMAGLFGIAFSRPPDKNKGLRLRFCLLTLPFLVLPIGWMFPRRPSAKKRLKRFKRFRLHFRFLRKSRKHIFRMLKGFKTFTYYEKVKGKIKFGFKDPALTGEIQGYLALALPFRPKRIDFYSEPVFYKPCFLGKMESRLWIFPLGFLMTAAVSFLILSYQYKKIVFSA